MKCIGLFYGGSSYRAPDGHNPRDVERFQSLKSAADTFWSRTDFDPDYPCVDDAAEMHIYFSPEYHENGPDRIITLGKRGGVRIDRA